jgi:hypothetical protein
VAPIPTYFEDSVGDWRSRERDDPLQNQKKRVIVCIEKEIGNLGQYLPKVNHKKRARCKSG